MKKLSVAIVVALFFLSGGFVAAKHFWRGETMSKQQASQRWGSKSFDPEKFKKGDEKTKSSMAHAILENQKQFVGKDRSQIRAELGDFDGFYFSDMFPTYMIESGAKQTEDSWQIVFLLDRNEKVSEIIVHKNCCDR